jgi:L-alanine-DL-glutamate epimerase-like enolase superfamily enzyme
MSVQAFAAYIERDAVDIVMPDVVWCGGLSAARRICALADRHYLPVTSHDTVGPVALLAAAHLMLHIPNALIMEVVRGYVDGWYREVLDRPFAIADGQLALDEAPGLGAALRPELLADPRLRREESA